MEKDLAQQASEKLSEAEYSALANREYQTGKETGAREARESIIRFLQDKAGGLFVQGKDEQAKWLRDIIRSLGV